ncbi:MAG TPA: hypothetical protein DCQ26_18025 [Marinilabiliales bacterium]|nr:MAG: hypothetical protein A2W95_16495 [Bacteroidetes bacterium GWA2_40_14]OFX57643.1 MAG: hypothetical protein A2W84_04485 [Bacteroidetes bacterium GWC2_40_13]OFX73539.1 MAG: hypothetical protein A2W96_02615 [Bacteroidetes bacterium GWD2_40_43]OFX90785.1 MAG: hypothetical protein A2W97_03430 [Bacteroidetes bacterium GWE2_40_63]OFY20583.1 MAG: hypothetical protein A2W88_13410 [Bacteroidetes bacterium GWF2_40_13]OFZ24700.1 MAG: hypothetical protein A2437_03890 [Bacteroidetes bacterium RIFOXYC
MYNKSNLKLISPNPFQLANSLLRKRGKLTNDRFCKSIKKQLNLLLTNKPSDDSRISGMLQIE